MAFCFRKISGILFLFIVCVAFSSTAQIKFQRTYGGNLINEGRSVKQTLDGGYIIAGSTSSFGYGSMDVLLIKTDSLGNGEFMKTYGGSNVDQGFSVLQLSDSGYLVAGYTNSFGNGGYDAYLVRTDKNGDTLWTKTYGGADWDFVYSLKPTSDGGFVIAGNTYSYGNGNSDGWILKTNLNGDFLWQKTFITSDDDFFNSIDSGFSGCFVAAGYKMNGDSASEDIIAARISSTGDSLWYYSFGDSLNEVASVVHSLHDSSYLIGGKIVLDSVQTYGFLMKIDTNGNPLWTNNSVIDKKGFNDLYDFVELQDHRLDIAATDMEFGAGGVDIYQQLADNNGNYLSAPTHGGIGTDIAYSISKTSDNGFILVGETNSYAPGLKAVYLVKTDSSGISTPKDSVIIGITLYKETQDIVYLFPNPAHFEINIDLTRTSVPVKNSKMTFQLFNSIGEMIMESLFNENIKTLALDHVSPGLYFYCLSTKGIIYSKGKLVIE